MAFGRFEQGAKPQVFSEINVTPLVDVMLVLVVILLITAPLLGSAIRLDLPRASGAQVQQAPRFVTLVMDGTGQTFLQDQPVSLEQLGRSLTQTARQNPDTEVQLRADTSVPYGRVVEVMGVAQTAGLSRIGFVADAPPTAKTR